jgi:signal transduction histidine kinase/ActR/RegA family two-component response regulator
VFSDGVRAMSSPVPRDYCGLPGRWCTGTRTRSSLSLAGDLTRIILRRRIILLVLAALLPVLALLAGLAVYSLLQQQATMRTDAMRLAGAIRQATEHELHTQIELLRVLAQSPLLEGAEPDLKTFHQIATSFVQQFPLWSRVILVRPDGQQLVNTGLAFGAELPTAVDAQSLRRLLDTRAPVVGDLTGPGPLRDDRLKIAIRVPVLGSDGVARYALTVTVSPRGLSRLIEQAGVTPGWRPFLLDSAGRILAYPSTPHRVGQMVVQQTLEARERSTEGVYQGVAADGVRTVAAFERLSIADWSAHVSIPEPIYLAPLRRSLLMLAAAGLIALALSLLFAWMIRQEMRAHRREQQLRDRAGRMDALGRMTGGVAHDFNNLLMVVLGNLEMLQRRLGASPPVERYLTSIRRAAERGTQLTRELLAFSRGGPCQPEVVDLGERVGQVLSMLRQSLRGDIAIDVEAADGPYPAEVDPIQLDLALLNVAVNARDAMPDGGRLSIRIDRAAFPDRSGRSGLRLSLSDTGGGVAPEVLPHVFEPFFTTKDVGKGTGLGLSQVYGFAKASGGFADIASQVGRGTVVTLYIPEVAHPALAPAAPEPRPAQPRSLARADVLLVDDNDDVRSVTADFLADAGFAVEAVSAPDVALARLDRGQADILVSDLVMPGAMDGLALALAARRNRPHLPVVLVSGYSASIERARELGFTVLAKPFAADALIAALQAALGKRENAAPPLLEAGE